MIVRDLFVNSVDIRVIARAIFEDNTRKEEIDVWIRKYYSLLTKLKNSKVHKSRMMFYFSVICDGEKQYGCVSGFEYDDIVSEREVYYALEYLNYRKYASLYVPEYTVQRYGAEVVAAEALREYGWNDYDESVICTDVIRKQVIEELEKMETGIFPVDKNYFNRCRRQFKLSYQGKPIPLWEEDKKAPGVAQREHSIAHVFPKN